MTRRHHASRGGTPATRGKVPWSKVGPGWELAEYTAGPAGKAYPVTLYLIGPAGQRYTMHTWGAHATVPYLIAWSGDKTRALLGLTGSKYEQLTLATGKLTTGNWPGRRSRWGTRCPAAQNILGVTEGNSAAASATVARYSLAGKLVKVLTRGVNENTAVYAANGATLAVSGAKGLELVSNAGGVIRSLPVPGADPSIGCDPARWWNGSTVLAQCIGKGTAFAPRLWLVPTDGKRPVALTPQRNEGADLGDIGAWQLSSGLYLQALRGVRDRGDLPAGRQRVHHGGAAAHRGQQQRDRDRARRPAADQRADRLPRQRVAALVQPGHARRAVAAARPGRRRRRDRRAGLQQLQKTRRLSRRPRPSRRAARTPVARPSSETRNQRAAIPVQSMIDGTNGCLAG